jgi:hypothetical protein
VGEDEDGRTLGFSVALGAGVGIVEEPVPERKRVSYTLDSKRGEWFRSKLGLM